MQPLTSRVVSPSKWARTSRIRGRRQVKDVCSSISGDKRPVIATTGPSSSPGLRGLDCATRCSSPPCPQRPLRKSLETTSRLSRLRATSTRDASSRASLPWSTSICSRCSSSAACGTSRCASNSWRVADPSSRSQGYPRTSRTSSKRFGKSSKSPWSIWLPIAHRLFARVSRSTYTWPSRRLES
jgi:hypothetical protein